ncbi:CRISPR-associated endoribonuclease Cas6 [Candidatus Absconditicoccus praedator]|uniref:CRISPR-associated endoribonuclease Cas6 n=1 Tax=Candidatus Absconditicoccus praedator TaxID=2735562 RepID=UPI001E509313|nr:CRISPR-associated endoribonuclease Cas6 [Candidatus Absconditicoccus praedator]UFX82683.1 hypothetical protein HLG78_00840 [Candidatus Absconditicoccus praedator]
MKLDIKFQFEQTQEWSFDSYKLQGLFFNLMREDPNRSFHNLPFGLFCYSNIFPFEKGKDYQPGVDYNITFSSIDQDIINQVYQGVLTYKQLNFGDDNKIHIKNAYVKNQSPLYPGKQIKLVTPVVLSLDEQLIRRYEIPQKPERKGKPLYWKKEMGFEVFIKQLNKNILKKYVYLIKNNYVPKLNDFDQKLLEKFEDIEAFEEIADRSDFFKGYKFKRGALVDFKGGKIAGSLWDFVVGDDRNLNKALKYVSAIGVGERCTAGFGFIK